ncbi:MAG: hypothetical protein HY600_03250 [Candidatus Omnitrophica bacterium]|nr:hypothetical protein [Candidatus Omnitrophota bacterium]
MKATWGIWLVLIWLAVPALAEAGEELVTKEVKGFRFKVPADWPVEERNGTVAPIPSEEYLSKKFLAITTRFEAAEKRLTTMETKQAALESQMAVLDKRVGAVDQRLTVVERAQGDQGRALQVLQAQAKSTPAPAPAPAAPANGDLVPQQPTGEGQ